MSLDLPFRSLVPAIIVLIASHSGTASRAEDARTLAQDAYAKTKTAKTEEELGEILELCQQAADEGPTETLAEYIHQLLSWTYNRRGELYADQAASALAKGDKDLASQLDDKALADFEASLKKDAKRWKAMHNRGVSYALKGKYSEAAADFQSALEIKPDYANAWFNLGEIRFDTGELDQALQDYTEAIRLSPKDAVAYARRGRAHLHLEQFESAIEDLTQAVQLDDTQAEAHALRGATYQKQKKWQEAALDLRRATTLDTHSALAFRTAAWLMATCPDERFRNPELAIQAAKRALQLTPKKDEQFQDALAAAYANAGQFDEAIATLAKFLESVESESAHSRLESRLKLYRSGKPYRQGEVE